MMRNFVILEKSVPVKGFVRTREGKIERVNPFTRKGDKKATGKYKGIIHLLEGLESVIHKWKITLIEKNQSRFTPEQRSHIKKKLAEIREQVERNKLTFTPEQKAHIHKRLAVIKKEIVFRKIGQVVKEGREKFSEAEKPHKLTIKPPESKKEILSPEMKSVLKKLDKDMVERIKRLGYSVKDINKLSESEAKAIYWNDISRKEVLGKEG